MFDDDPVATVNSWYDEEGELHEQFIRMATLATISPEGTPTMRQIEIPSIDEKGATFFTHRSSRKSQHLMANGKSSLNIWLPKTKRQVGIEGMTTEMQLFEANQWWERMPSVLQRCFLEDDDDGEAMPHEFIGFRMAMHRLSFYEIRFPEVSNSIIAERDGASWSFANSALL